MHKTFKLNVQAVIKNGDKVLLLRRSGKWNMSGGRYEETDQSIEEALGREIKEETGIKEIEIGDILLAKATDTSVLLFYSATTNQIDVTISHEHDEHGWFDETELKSLDYEYDLVAEIITKGS